VRWCSASWCCSAGTSTTRWTWPVSRV
jgi:hypothetical protein